MPPTPPATPTTVTDPAVPFPKAVTNCVAAAEGRGLTVTVHLSLHPAAMSADGLREVTPPWTWWDLRIAHPNPHPGAASDPDPTWGRLQVFFRTRRGRTAYRGGFHAQFGQPGRPDRPLRTYAHLRRALDTVAGGSG